MAAYGAGSALHRGQAAAVQGSSYDTCLKEQHSVPVRSIVRSYSKEGSSSLGNTPRVAASISSIGSLGPPSFEAGSMRAHPYRSGSGSIPAYRSVSSSGEASRSHGLTPRPSSAAGMATGLESSSRSSSGKLGGHVLGSGMYKPSTTPLDASGSVGDMSR